MESTTPPELPAISCAAAVFCCVAEFTPVSGTRGAGLRHFAPRRVSRRRIRNAVLGQGDQRGRLRPAEVCSPRHAEQQHRPSTRLCHSPLVEAMLAALGSGATSNSYVDYDEAGCLVIVGSDANSNHPVAAARMRRAVVERGAKPIVINPRRIEMCDIADLWLRPRPGTDVALFNGIARVIPDQGPHDEKFVEYRTEGFDEWREPPTNTPPSTLNRSPACPRPTS